MSETSFTDEEGRVYITRSLNLSRLQSLLGVILAIGGMIGGAATISRIIVDDIVEDAIRFHEDESAEKYRAHLEPNGPILREMRGIVEHYHTAAMASYPGATPVLDQLREMNGRLSSLETAAEANGQRLGRIETLLLQAPGNR